MKNYLAKRNNDLGFNFFDDFMGDFFAPSFFGANENMPTDVKETEKGYELSIGLAGFDKKDLNLSLNNGYLTVSAKKEESEKDNENFLRRERSYSCSRSYYVGEDVKEEEISAKYSNGVLEITVPKNDAKRIEHRNIQIN